MLLLDFHELASAMNGSVSESNSSTFFCHLVCLQLRSATSSRICSVPWSLGICLRILHIVRHYSTYWCLGQSSFFRFLQRLRWCARVGSWRAFFTVWRGSIWEVLWRLIRAWPSSWRPASIRICRSLSSAVELTSCYSRALLTGWLPTVMFWSWKCSLVLLWFSIVRTLSAQIQSHQCPSTSVCFLRRISSSKTRMSSCSLKISSWWMVSCWW